MKENGETIKRRSWVLIGILACLALVCLPGCLGHSSMFNGSGNDGNWGAVNSGTKTDDWQYGVPSGRKDGNNPTKPVAVGKKVDDWKYDNTSTANTNYQSGGVAAGPSGANSSPPSAKMGPAPRPAPTVAVPPSSMNFSFSADAARESMALNVPAGEIGKNIGFSTGGAKDINNFRENIKNGYLPLPTDVTYEGLFYDYYFDTGQMGQCDSLFCPSYTYAVSEDPFSGEVEYYLAVGLNSGMKESDFERKKLNLVIVLDISGSMGSSFDRYYYDRFGNQSMREGTEENWRKSKMQVATESVVALLDHLNDDDRFGMVLFDGGAYLAKPLNLIGETDMDAIKEHIMDITARGSTNLAAGMEMGTDLFGEFLDVDRSEYENRIIFLTDAMPNTGDISERGLLGMAGDNADDNLYSTFIGIGVDFNTEPIEYITKIKGANYYSVHSAKEFEERMVDEFEYMVTPLVFDLKLQLEANGWEIEKVYGSPEADEATGELMKVNTLFPSKTEGGQTRGGLVLLKLKKLSSDAELSLTVSYEDRNGNNETVEDEVTFEGQEAEYFDNTGIRKGILLSRYASLLIDWIVDERDHAEISRPWEPMVNEEIGIPVPPPIGTILGRWERQSLPLTVSEAYEDLFKEFMEYFEAEMEAIGDDTLEQELEVLNDLS